MRNALVDKESEDFSNGRVN